MLRNERYGQAVDVYAYALVVHELYARARPYPLSWARDINRMRNEIAINNIRPQTPAETTPIEVKVCYPLLLLKSLRSFP